ncbi:MAG: 3-isopropylmalate dehydratase large subunit [bacterium]|nr:3-isopropylmalate dehydratase large subunit [bacterium]
MPMTITEKILAAHAGRDQVVPGEFIEARVDIALGNDVTAPIAIREFESFGAREVFDRNRLVLVPDHYAPNKDIKSAEQCKIMRDFARRQAITNYFEVGQMGVEHALLPEQGLVLPGDLIIGADSHTCTYGALGAFSTGVGSTDLAAVMITGKIWLRVPESIKIIFDGPLNPWVCGKDLILYTIGQITVDGALYMAMEFDGSTIRGLDIDSRFSICNMAIEAGAKSGIIAPDEITLQYVRERARRDFSIFTSDPEANYCRTLHFWAEEIQPQVALPPLPENSRPVDQIGDIPIDQVVIGSCTNGRISDLRQAAQILKGHKVNPNVRLIIIPATQSIYRQAMKEGLLDIFLEAGAAVSTPTCGPCLGGYMGVLAAGERALATTNRNFIGRMGHLQSEVYLSNPAVAAASAITGKISHPREVVSD